MASVAHRHLTASTTHVEQAGAAEPVCPLLLIAGPTGHSIPMTVATTVKDGPCASSTAPASVWATSLGITVGDAVMVGQDPTVTSE